MFAAIATYFYGSLGPLCSSRYLNKIFFWSVLPVTILMDHSGILPLVKDDLDLSNFQMGLLYSAFIVTYAPLAPFVGYLGDRYSRKYAKI